jgi:hypothetical protein
MCFFVCLAVPKTHAPKLNAASHAFEITDATEWSIGEATYANRDRDSAFLVTVGGCSCFISEGKKHRTDALGLNELDSLIESVLQQVPSLSILIHYATGDVSRERVIRKDKRLVSFDDVRSQYSQLELDVRYAIKGLRS